MDNRNSPAIVLSNVAGLLLVDASPYRAAVVAALSIHS